ncbi:RING-type domain-containing protein [Aix galericulata]|nr:RING-type domain-containing protein [Aix galericulata]
MEAEAEAGSVLSGLSGGEGAAAAAAAGPAEEEREMEGAPSCSGSRPVPFEFERSRSESSGDDEEEDDEDDEEEEMEEEELEGDPGARFGTDDGELDSDDDREVAGGGGREAPNGRNGRVARQGPAPGVPRAAGGRVRLEAGALRGEGGEGGGRRLMASGTAPGAKPALELGFRERMINLAELTPYILCSICKGYFIDATTITECLHTFCKSCIVRHFYYSNRCPKCNIVVHQTQPLYNIRLDRQLQDIVYKLVVNLEEREKKQMHDFYKERGLEVPKPAVPQPVPASRGRPRKVLGSVFRIPPELDISILLEFIGANEGTGNFKPLEKKFVRVSGEATIGHVEKFLRRKMDLDPACQVDIICGDHLLEHYQTLREIRQVIGDSAVQPQCLTQ